MDSAISPNASEELAIARQILNYIMSPANANIAFPFMDRIDAQSLGLHKYDEIVRFPMWLRKISEKLDQNKYPGLREFVCDFRLILVNCFRYNGVSSRMGRIAEKLETLFEQKLQLLPQELRSKTTLHASLGCGSTHQDGNDSGPLRRRASARHYGGNLDSQISHPVRGLMEELEHSVPSQDVVCGGAGFGTGPSSANSAAAFLYEGSPGLQVTSANSHALLVARLTAWQARQHEAELIAGWKDWWQGNTRARTRLAQLRKCPQFLEAFQLLWLLDPFLGFSDAMAVGTLLYHDLTAAFHGDTAVEFDLLPLAPASSASSSRQFSLIELELGMCAAPQSSLCLAACISGLLQTPRERETVSAAVTALSEKQEQQRSEAKNNGTTAAPCMAIGEEDETEMSVEGGEESTRFASRRLQSSHVTTIKTLAAPPYDVWEKRLSTRLAQWYEEMPLEKRLEDPVRLERRYGISQAFFDVCGKSASPLEKRRFHELTVQQQAHILLALASTVLLSNGNFGFAENLRFSMDKSSDWDGVRPTRLGSDDFRGLTFFHFPEMLRSEAPRVVQYRFRPLNAANNGCFPPPSPPPTPTTAPPNLDSCVAIPGAVARLPVWMEPDLAQTVRSHLLALLERESEALGARCNERRGSGTNDKVVKKDRAKMQGLSAILASFQALGKESKTPKGRAKAKKRRRTVDPPRCCGDVVLADFAFVNRISCGSVPASAVYARQAGNHSSRNFLRAVESSLSLAESTTTITNTPETSTPTQPKFFEEEEDEEQEEEEEEVDSSPPESLQRPEEVEGEAADSPPHGMVLKPDPDLEGGNSSGSTASTTPCREASYGENLSLLVGMKEDEGDQEEKEEEEEEVEEKKKAKENEATTTAVRIKSETAAVKQCNGFGTVEEEDEEEGVVEAKRENSVPPTTTKTFVSNGQRGDNCEKDEASGLDHAAEAGPGAVEEQKEKKPSEEEKKTREVAELIARAAEAEVDESHCFETVVHDLDTLRAFQRDIASRLATGKRLLDELSSACDLVDDAPATEDAATDGCLDLRRAVDRFAAEMGDAVLSQIMADPQLAATLGPQHNGKVASDPAEKTCISKREEEGDEEKPLKHSRKRRKSGFVTPRPRKSARKSRAEPTAPAAEAAVEAESTRRQLLRLHEEALSSLSALASSLDALEAEAKANEEDRLAAERIAGLLLRKDIETRQPKPKPRPHVSITSPPAQIQTQTLPQRPPPRPPSLPILTAENRVQPVHPLTPLPRPSAVTSSGPRIYLPPSASSLRGPPQPTPIFIRRPALQQSTQPPTQRPRRIFRFYDTLFTEEGRPVRLEANGAMVYIPPESVPLGHRQMAMQMIERFRASSATAATPPS